MYYRLAADAVALIHVGFVIFVIAGALLVYRWRLVAIVHIPAVVWGVLLEFRDWQCPLTPLEQQLREAGSQATYNSGFVEHYFLPVLYPAELDRSMQIDFGSALIVINVALYGWVLWRLKKRATRTGSQ